MVTVPYRLMRNVMIAAGVLYCSLPLEAVAGYPLDIHESSLSELGARDQPTSPYARALDLGAGVLLLVCLMVATLLPGPEASFASLTSSPPYTTRIPARYAEVVS